MADALIPLVPVDCFFGCPHVVRELSPDTAHDRMEDHYKLNHQAQIVRLVGHPVVIGPVVDAESLLRRLADRLELSGAGADRDAPDAWDLAPSDHAALVELLAQIAHSVERCADGIAEAGSFAIPAGERLREGAGLAGQSSRQLLDVLREAGFGTAAPGFPVERFPHGPAADLRPDSAGTSSGQSAHSTARRRPDQSPRATKGRGSR
jgi:hypothetical protein